MVNLIYIFNKKHYLEYIGQKTSTYSALDPLVGFSSGNYKIAAFAAVINLMRTNELPAVWPTVKMKNKLLIGISVILLALLGVSIAILIIVIQLAHTSNANELEYTTSTIVVSTENGRVRGRLMIGLVEQKTYYAFRGIPYAKPPIGELRFKPPEKVGPWTGIHNALEFGNFCYQIYGDGNEDCLFVNVYTPNVSVSTKLPVLIAIHGGAFLAGSSNDLGPDFILNEGTIILVTFNYRLGPLGFLTLNTTEYSGNMGLKDQLLAIKWTYENIHHFGGDKKQITLYGCSAGGVSAHMHVISPASSGLFQRAIISSGVAISPWASTFSDHRAILYQYASSTGNTILTANDLYEFLKRLDAGMLTVGTLPTQVFNGTRGHDLIWVPVVEPPNTVNPFFNKAPAEILDNNFSTNIDSMFGYTSDEAYAFIDPEMRNPTLLQSINDNFLIPFPLAKINRNLNYSDTEYSKMAQQIRNHYFDDHDLNASTIYNYSALVSDILFTYSIDRSVKIHARSPFAKTFYYKFSANDSFNVNKVKTYANNLNFPGATHGDDAYHIFGSNVIYDAEKFYGSVPINSNEWRNVRHMINTYASFVMNGAPRPSLDYPALEPVQINKINYLDINDNGFVMETDPIETTASFWDKLIKDFNLLL